MEEKTQIDEKRVKSTIIRRRKKVVKTAAEEAPSVKKEEGARKPSTGEVSSTAVAAKKGRPKKIEVSKPAEKGAKVADQKKSVAEVKKMIPLKIIPPIEEKGEEEEKGWKTKLKKVVKKKDKKLEVELEGIGKVSSIAQLKRISHLDRVERVFKPTKIGRRKKVISKKGQKKTAITVAKPIKRIIEMTTNISVGDLSRSMGVKSSEVIKKLMGMGTMATVNQMLDFDTALLIAREFDFEVKNVAFDENKILEGISEGVEKKLKPRPPVVTVMGHVDHGKTSLLDAIRQTNVTAGESGGITQHIGAYTINLPKGKVTFLDTPGHAAFTAMRARGASVTDIVVLVVAADDGVMPQTVESIDHAKAANVPIVAAVNKIDKPEANIDRIKRQLADHGLNPEEWGGDTLYSLVSAKKKEGIEELLETILLQAEVLELKADPYMLAKGVVVEAKLDRYRGPVATVLVQHGTLKGGDAIVAGSYSGNIRAMLDHHGEQTNEAPPSYAVEIMGLDGVPNASDPFHIVPDEKTAKMIAENRRAEKRRTEMAPMSKVTLEDFFSKMQSSVVAEELGVIIKADVQGSLEAVSDALTKLSTDKVKLKIIHGAVGGVTESDVLLASASNAIIIGFNVRPETKALATAQSEMVDVKLYKVIYEMVEEVKLAMQGLLAPTKKEKYLGRTEVKQTFAVSKVGTIAGCLVVDGKVTRTSSLRLLRDNVVVYEGKVSSLKRFKDDAKEVLKGFECGLGIEGYQDIKQGDTIEAFEIELIKTEL